MKFSEKLNGYWEEGYHYYLEFRNEKLTVRGYDRSVTLETTVSYDADLLDSGERTVIDLADNILSRTATGEMMTEIKELAYDNGELKFLYYYTIMGETLYTLTKKEKGPFDHIKIRDEEFIDKLQGAWYEWNGDKNNPLIIKNNQVEWFRIMEKFHVVSYNYAPDDIYIVPESLTRSDFGAFTSIRVYPDMLTTTMMVCDMSMPLSVFAREDMMDKIKIPDAAKRPAQNTMIYRPSINAGISPMTAFLGMNIEPLESKKISSDIFCSSCGFEFKDQKPKFCPECGTKTE